MAPRNAIEPQVPLRYTRTMPSRRTALRWFAASSGLAALSQKPASAEPLVKHGKINASLRKDQSPDTVKLEEAVALLAGKAERPGRGRVVARGKAKSAAKPAKSAAKSTRKAGGTAKAPRSARKPPEGRSPTPRRAARS